MCNWYNLFPHFGTSSFFILHSSAPPDSKQHMIYSILWLKTIWFKTIFHVKYQSFTLSAVQLWKFADFTLNGFLLLVWQNKHRDHVTSTAETILLMSNKPNNQVVEKLVILSIHGEKWQWPPELFFPLITSIICMTQFPQEALPLAWSWMEIRSLAGGKKVVATWYAAVFVWLHLHQLEGLMLLP